MNRTAAHAAPACLLVLPVLVACAGADARSAAVVRDSAGVTIIENTAPGAGTPRWSLGEAPDVVIGMLEGRPEEQLFRVRSAVRLPDGRIAIANGGTNEIRFFDASGTYLEATGRDGEGPGEFRGLGGLLPFQDSLLVPDFGMRRVSALTLDGTFARSFPFPHLGDRASAIISSMFGDGTVLVDEGRIFFAGEESSGVFSDSSAYYRMDRAGTLIDTLGRFPDAEAYVHSEGRSMSVTSLLFGRRPSATAGGQRFYFASGDRYEIRVFDLVGTLERIIRLDRSPWEVTPADLELAKAEQLDAISDPGFRTRMERMLGEMPIPSTMPTLSDLEVDADGNLWAQSYRRPGEERATWSVFDTHGQLLAELETPPQFTIFQIGTDWLLGRRTDELEVERVELYRFSRGDS